jgi:hypothetical protein
MLIFFLERFGQEYKVETQFNNFLINFFRKLIWKSLYFYVFIWQLVD